MPPFHDSIKEYKKQLKKGEIQEAYRGLMEYIMGLRTHLKNSYPDYFVSGLYQGYMDMTYFSFTPRSFKQRNLRIAIVFLYETFRFEVWLSGYNKQVQAEYWKLFKESGWKNYHLVPITKGADSILEYVLADNPDFGNPDALTHQIERESLKFIRDIESYLSREEN
jgi:hypothetical protein